MYTDIHSHILPGIDDGSQSIEETKKLLLMQKAQGIDTVFATPHYDAELSDTPEKHKARCERILERLENDLKDADYPDIKLGFEVRYFRGISKSEPVSNMTLGDSRYLLLELNSEYQGRYVIDEIVEFSINHGITPILAHVERYFQSEIFFDLLDIISEGYAEAQINADSLLIPKMRKTCLKLIKAGHIKYVATDTHSVDSRPPHLMDAISVLEKKLGKVPTRRLLENSNSILKGEDL